MDKGTKGPPDQGNQWSQLNWGPRDHGYQAVTIPFLRVLSTGRNTPRVKNCLAPQERWCTAAWLGHWLPLHTALRWSTSPSSHEEAAEQSCHKDRNSVPRAQYYYYYYF